MEKQYEENQKELEQLSENLQMMNCKMQMHLKTIQDKSNFYATCQPPRTWVPAEVCSCSPGMTEPTCSPNPSAPRYK